MFSRLSLPLLVVPALFSYVCFTNVVVANQVTGAIATMHQTGLLWATTQQVHLLLDAPTPAEADEYEWSRWYTEPGKYNSTAASIAELGLVEEQFRAGACVRVCVRMYIYACVYV